MGKKWKPEESSGTDVQRLSNDPNIHGGLAAY
jgi:hypothetical protein